MLYGTLAETGDLLYVGLREGYRHTSYGTKAVLAGNDQAGGPLLRDAADARGQRLLQRGADQGLQVRDGIGACADRFAGRQSRVLRDRRTGLESEDLNARSAGPWRWRGDALSALSYQWIWHAGIVTKTGRNTIVLKLPAGDYYQRFGVALARLASL